MQTTQPRLVALVASSLVAAVCIVGVVVGVVMTGTDGTATDWFVFIGLAALVVPWRLYTRIRGQSIAS